MSALRFSKLVVPAPGPTRIAWGAIEGDRSWPGAREFLPTKKHIDISDVLADHNFYTQLDENLKKKRSIT